MSHPILQVVHLSDIHFARYQVRRRQSRRTRSRLFRLASLIPQLGAALSALEQGLAGHDPSALVFLNAALQEISEQQRWSEVERWLVVTGDQTTWGHLPDNSSVLTWLEGRARQHGFGLSVTYGNHDVWPDTQPILAPVDGCDIHRSDLRAQIYRGDWPQITRLVTIDNRFGGGAIYLCSLNSVRHERIWNFLARGIVREDRYWETHTPILTHQLEVLKQFPFAENDIVLVAIHHPIFDPQPRSFMEEMLLENRDQVAQVLQGLGPKVRLVLAGHTHQLDPEFGRLPAGFPCAGIRQSPVDPHQLQLTVSSAAQAPVNPQDEADHGFQLLQFSGEKSGGLVMDRLVYNRPDGVGPFEPLYEDNPNDPNDRSQIAEEVRLR